MSEKKIGAISTLTTAHLPHPPQLSQRDASKSQKRLRRCVIVVLGMTLESVPNEVALTQKKKKWRSP